MANPCFSESDMLHTSPNRKYITEQKLLHNEEKIETVPATSEFPAAGGNLEKTFAGRRSCFALATLSLGAGRASHLRTSRFAQKK